MRYTPALEEALLDAIRGNTGTCITFAPDAYGANGQITVYRDNLSEALHRRLFRLVFPGWLKRRDFLLPTCATPGCQNPYHRERSSRVTRQRRAVCPNGHAYSPETDLTAGTLRCAICFLDRRTRRGLTGTPDAPTRNAAKTHCPVGHAFQPDNTYFWTDPRGGVHRKCKTCTREKRRLSYADSQAHKHQPEGQA